MPKPLSDEQAQARIEELEEEERRLRRDESENPDTDQGERVAADARRLEEVRVELDRLWDYLRQRRALRGAGRNPDDARMRDAGTVEDYLG
jgi:Protein of unknown function (DUF2630)